MEILLAVLAALIAVNWWATRRIMAIPESAGAPRRMLVAEIWLIPFLGALMAQIHAPRRPPGPGSGMPGSAAPGPRDAAPQVIEGPGSADFIVGDHLAGVNGMPVLDWRALDEWAHAQHPGAEAAAARAIEQGRRAWLLHLRDAMGPHAHLHATDDAFILSTMEEPRVLQATASYVSTARGRIARVLGGLARFPPSQRSILIVFDSEEDYYHYVSIYYPERGEFAFSGGMHINAGCPHFVLVRADLSAIEPVIAHELTHSALSHLRLPKWLDEGLAVNTEHKVAGARHLLHTPHELHQMHLQFWNPERIQEFWSGASFNRTDDGNLLSYELARIIVEQMARHWESFAEFARSAKREDAGEAAAQAALSLNLGPYAAALLEMEAGDAWSPQPSSW